MQFLRSTNIQVGANYVGTDVSGNANFAVGMGILANQVRNLIIGVTNAVSVYNGETAMMLESIGASGGGGGGGGGGGLINCHVGLNAAGDTPLGGTVNGLVLEDCSDFVVGGGFSGSGSGGASGPAAERNVFSGIVSNAMQFLRSTNIQVGANYVGTDVSGNASFAVGVGIAADHVRNLTIGATNAVSVFNASQVCTILRFVTRLAGGEANSMFNCHFGVGANGGSGFGSSAKGVVLQESEDFQIGKSGGSTSGNVFGGLANPLEIENSNRVKVRNSKFGTDATGTKSIRNSGVGVLISGTSHDVEIGGASPGEGNAIAHCDLEGIRMAGNGDNVLFMANLLYQNLKPIQRFFSGQHFPSIAKAFRGSTHVEGALSGHPGDTVRLEFFAHRPNRSTEGELFLGAINVPLNDSGSGQYAAMFPKSAPGGWLVASTASDSFAGTSEFSASLPIGAAPDSDGDGMPDFWEALYPGCLNPLVPDGNGDCDHDGFSNLQEYIAQTDPTKANSALRVENLVAGGDGATLNFTGVAGRQYGLERRVDLNAGTWVRVATAIPETDGQVSLTDPAPPPGHAYYRLVAEFP
jgi:hypothetical protein